MVLVSLFFLKARLTFITSTASSSTSRISNGFSDTCDRLLFGPGEPEGRAGALRRFDPGLAAFAFDYLLHDGQANPGALDAIARLERLEHPPDALVELRSDARPIVPDR